MGIEDLNKVIKRVCPRAFTEVHLSTLHGKTIAMDTSLYVYKYVKSQGEMWLGSMIRMLLALKRNRIKIVCVYDGTDVPIEKTQERIKRSKTVDRSEERLQEIHDVMDMLENDHMFSAVGVPENIVERIQKIVYRRRGMTELTDTTDYTSIRSCYNALERAESSVAAQSLRVTKRHMKLIHTAIELMGIPSVQAPGEAEATCAAMCREGLVYGVLSDDTDVLVYRTPIALSKLDLRNETVVMTGITEVLNGLELSYDSFLDMCIMLGCDYNTRISGYGAVKCYDMITKYGKIEDMPLADTAKMCLLHERCREIFSMEHNSGVLASDIYVDEFDRNGMRQFLIDHGVRMRVEEISKVFDHGVVFE
uniref:XPG N-terminal domain-containing protein n=1 Tax=viral metagenome TaxID=1070528 RepID=A0A6C0LZQ8_9ZZZZ